MTNKKEMVSFKMAVREAYRFLVEDNTRSQAKIFLWIEACAIAMYMKLRDLMMNEEGMKMK